MQAPPAAGRARDLEPGDDGVPVGRGSMPSFVDSLTPEQIAAVVDYTRNDLG